MDIVFPESSRASPKPDLVFKIDGLSGGLNDAIFLPGTDSVVTASEDRTMRIWTRRENGIFWPSVVEDLPSPVTCLTYAAESRRIFAGLDNGTVVEYRLADDLNYVEHVKDYLSHTAKVTGVLFSAEMNWIMSVSKDRSVAWCSTETRRCLGEHHLEHPATCIEYDPGSHYVFVGDTSGCITLLSLGQTNDRDDSRVVRELRGHGQAVTCLAWDSVNSRLFSGSSDHTVIFWDIGGAKGSAMELQGHSKEISSVYWWKKGISSSAAKEEKYRGVVISSGLDGLIIFWSMDPSRIETPNWSESDVCRICGSPFFWNVKKMWNNLSVGVRQHHCRRCGHAVCDKCSPYRSTLPYMGFEKEVRICSQCFPVITDTDRRSLATVFNARHVVSRLRVEESLNLLLTVGKDRVVKVWDIKSLSCT